MPEQQQAQIDKARACAQDIKQNTSIPSSVGIGAITGAIAGAKGGPAGTLGGALAGGVTGTAVGMYQDAQRIKNCLKR